MLKTLAATTLALTSLTGFASSSKVVTCIKASSNTEVTMRIFDKDQGRKVAKNELLYLKVNGKEFFTDESNPVICTDAFSSIGNFGDYCEIDRSITAHVHLSEWIQYSGVIIYKDSLSIDDDIQLECNY